MLMQLYADVYTLLFGYLFNFDRNNTGEKTETL